MDRTPFPTLAFAHSSPLTLGVEIEIQLLDKETLDLKSCSPLILDAYKGDPSRVKEELFQSMLELNTGICANAHEVAADLGQTISQIQDICGRMGLRMASAGTHPFALYTERILYPAERYRELIDRNQWIARRLMIFGLHVHVGMRSGEHAIQMNNALLHYLPLLLALSASSPYWHGEDTELASSRITFFEAIPTGGHPCALESWADFEELHAKLIKCGAIRSTKDIWWDIRPSPSFGTLEIRICDGLPTLAETVAITALIHVLCRYIDRQLQQGRRFRPPPDWILRENKWRASRSGTEATLLLNEAADITSLGAMASELFRELSPLVREESYQHQFELLERVLQGGGSSFRQRAARELAKGDIKKVADFLAREFEDGSPIWLDEASGSGRIEK